MTNRKKPLVIVTRKLPDAIEARMRELFDVQLNRGRSADEHGGTRRSP